MVTLCLGANTYSTPSLALEPRMGSISGAFFLLLWFLKPRGANRHDRATRYDSKGGRSLDDLLYSITYLATLRLVHVQTDP